MTDTKPTLSLVLGSGGARGHAHIGVIRAIDERGLRIRNIAGCSMGALIGGIYAAGQLDTYTTWANQLDRGDVVRLLDLSFTWRSIFKGERIFDVLRELVGERRIEELDRGFVAVATSLDEQREVWLNKGPLFRAIRASCAVPGVFSPVEFERRTLVDGGLVNPIPIAPTLNDQTDLTIAVNLNAIGGTRRPGPVKPARREKPAAENNAESAGYREKIAHFLSEYFSGDDERESESSASEILSKSIDAMQGTIARMKLATYAPDKVVEIPRHACSFFEFNRAQEMAELGYEATCRALDDLSL
jgi:NTE family protein